MTRFEIEMKVAEVMCAFAAEHDLEMDFYGDCYPQEIMELENRMERMNDEQIQDALEELVIELEAVYL